ncbi:MAG: hypothetical protein LAO31_20720 [Acidobacteriia bacterium]|nr:hypothetical protein [Terriglobia bacterium]
MHREEIELRIMAEKLKAQQEEFLKRSLDYFLSNSAADILSRLTPTEESVFPFAQVPLEQANVETFTQRDAKRKP